MRVLYKKLNKRRADLRFQEIKERLISEHRGFYMQGKNRIVAGVDSEMNALIYEKRRFLFGYRITVAEEKFIPMKSNEGKRKPGKQRLILSLVLSIFTSMVFMCLYLISNNLGIEAACLLIVILSLVSLFIDCWKLILFRSVSG